MYWQRRLTRLEFGLYGGLLAAFVALFADRALYYMELAERTAMEMTITHVNSGLQIRLASDLLQATKDRALVAGANPLELAGLSPSNFAGEASADSTLGSAGRGVWLFDRSRSQLIYLPRLHRGLETTEQDGALRFHLAPSKPDGLLRLVPTSTYRWQ